MVLDLDLLDSCGEGTLSAAQMLTPEASIIVFSGNTSATVRQRCMALGAIDVIAKGLSCEALSSAFEVAFAKIDTDETDRLRNAAQASALDLPLSKTPN